MMVWMRRAARLLHTSSRQMRGLGCLCDDSRAPLPLSLEAVLPPKGVIQSILKIACIQLERGIPDIV